MKKYKEPERLIGIGERLNAALAYLNLNQADLARQGGFSESQVSNWLSGTGRPGLDAGLALEEKFGIPMNWIYLDRACAFETKVLKFLSSRPTDNLETIYKDAPDA